MAAEEERGGACGVSAHVRQLRLNAAFDDDDGSTGGSSDALVRPLACALQLGTLRWKYSRFVRTTCWMLDSTMPLGL